MTILLRSALFLLTCLAALAASAASDLTLRYDRPAPDTPQGWEREALPIGNGRIGAMIFGQLARERIQFNDITLWTGDAKTMGAYQPFGDLFINLPGHDADSSAYTRRLSLDRSLHSVGYTHGGVRFERQAFASHPAQAIVVRLSADRKGQYTGSIELTDMHDAQIGVDGARLTASGALPGNALAYASQVQVVNEGGTLGVDGKRITFTNCDALTLVLGAGTSYALDAAKQFRGEAPLPRVAAQVGAAAARPWQALLAEHQKDFGALFQRVAIDLGTAAPARRALPTDQRIEAYTAEGKDPELEAQFFQYGRYLLISSSRDALPANLQGLWNNSLTPPWKSDYHTNINIQMNYWPAEPANLSELAQPFFHFVRGLAPAYRQHPFLNAAGAPARGWTVRTESNPFGAMGYLWNKTGNAWYAQHFWEHYAYTQDRAFLRDVAYPLMKEVCAFWQDQLKALPDGRLVAPLGVKLQEVIRTGSEPRHRSIAANALMRAMPVVVVIPLLQHARALG